MDRETAYLVQLAKGCTHDNKLPLIEVENRLAHYRHTSRFNGPLTAGQEHFLSLSTLPFQTNRVAYCRLLDLWDLQVPLIQQQGRLCMPTGSLNAKYMILGDAPCNIGRHRKDYSFERAFTMGAYATLLRLTLKELHLHTQVWYSTLLKATLPGKRLRSTPEEARPYHEHVLKEIEAIQPQAIILLGKYTSRYFNTHFASVKLPIITVHHPMHYAKKQNGIKIMAQDLFDRLF